eukprot:434003_1
MTYQRTTLEKHDHTQEIYRQECLISMKQKLTHIIETHKQKINFYQRQEQKDAVKNEQGENENNVKMQQQIQKIKIETISNWLKLCKDSLGDYKNKIYKSRSSIISREFVKQRITDEITHKYTALREQLQSVIVDEIKSTQAKKCKDMPVITLSSLSIQLKTNWRAEKYKLQYYVPTSLPPTYNMQFSSIDLCNIDEMKTQKMNNIQYDKMKPHRVELKKSVKSHEKVKMKNSQVKQKSSKKSQSQSKSQTKSQKSQAKSQQSQHESQTKVKQKSKNCRSHGKKSDKSQGKVKVKVKEK